MEHKVVVDPGHGAEDPGAVDGLSKEELDEIYSEEDDLNWLIAKKLYDILSNRGYDLVLTRKKDEFISLQERADMANQFEADIFVSIHNNAAANTSAQGYEVLYWHTSNKGKLLAQDIYNTMAQELNWEGRGIVGRDNLHVLKETDMPAVLIECGFITNPVEEHLLNYEGYRLLLAKAIANGIEAYFKGE